MMYFILAILTLVALMFAGVFDAANPSAPSQKLPVASLPVLPVQTAAPEQTASPALPKPADSALPPAAAPLIKETRPQLSLVQNVQETFFVSAVDEGDGQLVDIPDDWMPGGKHHVSSLADYVDFSELDRYEIEAEPQLQKDPQHQPVETASAVLEHIDEELGFWRSEDVAEQYAAA